VRRRLSDVSAAGDDETADLVVGRNVGRPVDKITKVLAPIQMFHPRGLYYKTFYGRNLRIFIIS